MLSFLRQFSEYLKPYRKMLALAVITMILVDATAYLLPELIRYLTDNVYSRISEPGMLRRMVIICLILMGSAFFRGLMAYTMIRAYWSVSESLVKDLRNTLYDKIQHLELEFYDQARVGDLMSRVTNDILLIRNFFSWGIEHRLRIILLTSTIFVLMLFLEWRLALCIYAIMPAFGFILLKFSKKMGAAVDKKQKQLGCIRFTDTGKPDRDTGRESIRHGVEGDRRLHRGEPGSAAEGNTALFASDVSEPPSVICQRPGDSGYYRLRRVSGCYGAAYPRGASRVYYLYRANGMAGGDAGNEYISY